MNKSLAELMAETNAAVARAQAAYEELLARDPAAACEFLFLVLDAISDVRPSPEARELIQRLRCASRDAP